MPQAQPNMIEMFLPFVAIFVIFYFLIIRPQSQKLKKHEGYLKELRKGDEVVTLSGILGRIDDLTDQLVTLEITKGIKIRILRKQIAGSSAEALATPAKPEAKK